MQQLLTHDSDQKAKALAPNHPSMLLSIYQKAILEERLSNYEDSEQLLVTVLKGFRDMHGDRHDGTVQAMWGLANVQLASGKFMLATKMIDPAAPKIRKVCGKSPMLAQVTRLHAEICFRAGQLFEAERLCEQGLQMTMEFHNTAQLRRMLQRLTCEVRIRFSGECCKEAIRNGSGVSCTGNERAREASNPFCLDCTPS